MTLITLPDELKAILTPLITFLVTEGLKAVGVLFGIDLSGRAAAVTAAVVGALYFFANVLLAKIPAGAEGIAASLFALVVALLSAYGIHRQVKRFAD